MQKSTLWSLRLGFSAKQDKSIQEKGIEQFLRASFTAKYDNSPPAFMATVPKTVAAMRAYRDQMKKKSEEEQKMARRQSRKNFMEFKTNWLQKMMTSEYPLREKMVCFWHNHFVATAKKVKVNYWIFQHHTILREHAFGNFRELTKLMVKSNAIVRYLDNDDNKAGKINENLSRELLELFTLGIGNYSEADIKNGARALAGLAMNDEGAAYREHRMDQGEINYFGKKGGPNTAFGRFKADDLVDIIFEQESAPYLITRKILQWFIYDQPDDQLIKKYGDYLRKVDFEIQPLLEKIFTDEFSKNNSGSKIKDPLVYSLQLVDELNIKNIDLRLIAKFLEQQGMDLFNQPNVKGWSGGRSWLTSQIFLQRNETVDALCNGRKINGKYFKAENGEIIERPKATVNWNKKGDQQSIINSFAERLIFQVDEQLQKDMEAVLNHDFNPKSEYADQTVLRLVNFILKTPEFQLV